jgi:multiple sugar transport system ATP-binding protein
MDLAIEDGEFIVLVGPSGCGKSTLLRMIAGLESITAGTIRIGGAVVNDLPPKDRDIAMVFQSYALYPHMNVADNMSYSLRLRRTPKERLSEAVADTARILGLQPYLQRRPRALSGGQRQRVAMGRAIVRKPKAFLFDEPLSNLDARLREQMRAEIKKLHRSLGATSVYVTHDQVEAMTMADRIVAMHDGVIQQVGTPLDIYSRPANVFVASFIGSPAMNFLSGVLTATEAGSAIRIAGAVMPMGTSAVGLKELPIILGIRPEHIEITDHPNAPIEARVDLIEPMGATTLVHASFAGGNLKIFSVGPPRLKPGASIRLRFPEDRLHLFDAASEARIF